MANYICSTKTNDFRVTDLDAFRDLMDRCSSEDELEVWKTTKEDGSIKVGFGVYGTFNGLSNNGYDEDDEEYEEYDPDESLDRFIAELQPLIHPDDACILIDVGWEKLRYVGGNALVITNKDTYNINLQKQAIVKTGELLGNPKYDTEF
ncbi:MAG: hypothetical protein HDQ88_11850 [Clostridia bacterium]|nr:hypothetical protein [Clostridia bacterium]